MFDNGLSLLAAAARNPDAVAIIDGERTFTYRALLETAQRLSFGLEALGVGPGERLIVVMQNRAEMAIAYWATQLSAIVFTPINWRTKAAELGYFITNSGASALLYDAAGEEAVRDCPTASDLIRITTGNAACEAIAFDDLIQAGPDHNTCRAGPDHVSVLLYTSGTTGPGKGVPRSHRAERAAALAHIAQNTYLSGEVTLGVMPLYHTMGVRSLLVMALINGTFICQHRFDPTTSLALIERHCITALYLVPTLYHDLLVHPHLSKTDISSVRKLGFAGAAMTDGLLRRVDAVFKPQIFVNHYGSSEIYTFTVNQRAKDKPGSAGRAGVNAQIKVMPIGATDVALTVPVGQPGHIIAHLASDEAFAGYWNKPDADERSLRDGWYLTGDIGHFDEEGDLFVTGRVDEMMISAGENILPSEIESVLSLHPAVHDVAVAGLPDERLGHRVIAFVVTSAPVSEADLDLWCRKSALADFKRPRSYRFVTDLPRSPVGKILRRILVSSSDGHGLPAGEMAPPRPVLSVGSVQSEQLR